MYVTKKEKNDIFHFFDTVPLYDEFIYISIATKSYWDDCPEIMTRNSDGDEFEPYYDVVYGFWRYDLDEWYNKNFKKVEKVAKRIKIFKRIIEFVLNNKLDITDNDYGYEVEELSDKIELYHLLLNSWTPNFETKYTTERRKNQFLKRLFTYNEIWLSRDKETLKKLGLQSNF